MKTPKEYVQRRLIAVLNKTLRDARKELVETENALDEELGGNGIYTNPFIREIDRVRENKLEEKPLLLEWEEFVDEDGNNYWEVDGPYNEGGTVFRWRIRQRLHNNNVVLYPDHDKELTAIFDTNNESGPWETAEEADSAIWNFHTNAYFDGE